MTLSTHRLEWMRANMLARACVVQLALCGLACSGPAAPSDSPVGYTEQRRSLGIAGGAGITTSAPALATSSSATDANPATAQPQSAAQTGPSSGTPNAPGASPATPALQATAATAAGAPPSSSSAPSITAAAPPAMSAGSAATAAAPSEAGKPAETSAPKATKLKLQFTTKSYGGMYQPVNLGAVWVEDANGKWVYTLEMWCGWQNTKSLKPYNAAGGVDYSVGLFPGSFTTMPPTDVVTSATLRQHKPHSNGAWSFKDSKGTEVPDGMYKLKLEMTEQEDEGKVLEVPFMKGAPPGPISAPDSAVFTSLKIELQ